MSLLGLLLVLRLSESGGSPLGLLLAVVGRGSESLLSEVGSLGGESGGGVRVGLLCLDDGGGLLVLVVLLLVKGLRGDGSNGRSGSLLLSLLGLLEEVRRGSLGLGSGLDVLGLGLVLGGLGCGDGLRSGLDGLGSVLLLSVAGERGENDVSFKIQ